MMSDNSEESSDQLLSDISSLEAEIDKIITLENDTEVSTPNTQDENVKKSQAFINAKKNIE